MASARWTRAASIGVVLMWALNACGGPSSAPTMPTPTPTPTPTPVPSPSQPFVAVAVLTDVLSGAAVSGVMASGTGLSGGPSDAGGRVSVGSDTSSSESRPVTFAHESVVSRQVQVKVPGAEAPVSLIPTTFDLDAFDEMLRVSHLLRWTTAPPLHVQSRLVQFTSTGANEAVGLDEVLTDEERAVLESDLTWALPQLTGNQFAAFAGITRETVDEGGRMSVLNSGMITVARYQGLQAATGYWGYSRWQYRTDGTVIGGTIMLDRDFDKSGSVYRRSLRAHELGHALGYTHVSPTRRASVMNSHARFEPNEFDRQATHIAFQRPPGNHRPDNDPAGTSSNVAAASAVWSVGAGGQGTRP